jgi:hypothetical protein
MSRQIPPVGRKNLAILLACGSNVDERNNQTCLYLKFSCSSLKRYILPGIPRRKVGHLEFTCLSIVEERRWLDDGLAESGFLRGAGVGERMAVFFLEVLLHEHTLCVGAL